MLMQCNPSRCVTGTLNSFVKCCVREQVILAELIINNNLIVIFRKLSNKRNIIKLIPKKKYFLETRKTYIQIDVVFIFITRTTHTHTILAVAMLHFMLEADVIRYFYVWFLFCGSH